MTDRDWLEKHLRSLMEIGDSIQRANPDLISPPYLYEKGYWTGLKLMLLKYYIPVYLNILSPSKRVAYVDLFAGPGLNLIGERSIPVPGSPMLPLAHVETKHRFDYYIFGDTNRDYIQSLKTRAFAYEDEHGPVISDENSHIDTIDANLLAREIPDILSRNNIDHCLMFIDPEGIDFRWPSLEFLMRSCDNSDLIILFPSSGMPRLFGRTDAAAWDSIRDYIGPGSDTLGPGSTRADALSIYRTNLSDLGKEISTEIQIQGRASFHYHLIPAVRRTGRGSPWFKSLTNVKNRIEGFQGDILHVISQQIEGELGRLF